MFTKSKVALLSILFVLFPLFFLPFTQEFFGINKFLLTYIVVFALLVVTLIQLLMEQKITISYSKVDTSVLLLLIATIASIAISSPNKVAAVFSFPLSFASLLCFYLVYLVTKTIPDEDWKIFKPFHLLAVGAIITGFISLVFFTNPFSAYPLPEMFSFLKAPLFNTIGSTLDLALFSGFFVAIAVGAAISKNKKHIPVFIAGGLAVIVIAANVFSIVKTNQFRLPPVAQSWLAAVETLKNPQTALFGVGVGNFAGQFTLVKDTAYNGTDLWNTNFALSRSAVLHIWTEMGIFGLVALLAVFATVIKLLHELFIKKDPYAMMLATGAAYLLVALCLFPPSLPIFFLLFVYLGLLVAQSQQKTHSFSLRRNMPVYLIIIFTFAIILPSTAYAVFRAYASEVYFKSALNALSTGKVVPIYQNLQEAILLNPYEEKYRLTFSQLNLLVANNIAVQKKDTLSPEDRQTITQAIQDAIREAKAAVALNPDKASNWENLAIIYQNLLNVAQGADSWAISAYQKAILLDPVNPQLRLSLGGVYYSLKQFPNAATFFSQAVTLKPDWSNARYNLAWAFYQNKEYDKAILVMQNVLTVIGKGSPDYEKAAADLATFQSIKANQAQTQVAPSATPSATLSTEQVATNEAKLGIPEEPKAAISPKIELPQ